MKSRCFRFVAGVSVCLAVVCWDSCRSFVYAADESPEILMIAGKPSHGYGSHEHYAGLKVLEESLLASNPKLTVRVVRGWPEDESLVTAADSIVIYCDGGGGHLGIPHRDALREKLSAGCGFVCIHYATEVPQGEIGDDWLKFLGGYFETHWSVNPHWVGDFKTLPKHPVTNGVQPFATNDEWYFHLRFANAGVTPILAAVAPEDTMRRPDGAHSGNPAVRKSVAAGELQTVAWTFDRPDGGRSFGFTGGHFHWNWGNDQVRRLVTNAIRWTAGDTISESGSQLDAAPMSKLLENQDYEPPKNFDPKKIAEEFHLSASDAVKKSPTGVPRLLKVTPLVTTEMKGHKVEIHVPINGVQDLYLVSTDGGNGYACDWVDWIDGELSGPQGTKTLVDIPWVSATTGFGEVHQNANCVNQPWSVDGKSLGKTCIGTHANSVIHFSIPKGFETFSVTAALDSGGTSQGDGRSTSVRFAVFADAPPADLAAIDGQLGESQRSPNQAIAGLTAAEGLAVTLSASEPQLRSLTNLDIDDRGRIWVCDVMNYRGNNGSRPEGDRVLILEDTNGDGVIDSSKTFYQGRDIDSAMGLCVLGNQVIVSASPTIWRFTDENGDDIPDRKEAMFTDVGQPQHDHSAHSFLFGPDGKLYWNFGNTGRQVKDAEGRTVVDIHGRPVVDDGRPLYGGMPFRCNLDGSEFEVLAHNFRNNWETTVDSYGTLWQSDNDDDGNKGTRINFVMEQGNFGYRDELTGGGWQQERINMETEIPLRHWHLSDPGVVPNLLQTGAGSPSGICFYEGDLLPKRFHNSMIHCEPGANIVRAYPTQPSGAGYTASIEPILTGTTDNWFRPADVCVAPDGSIFVTDWYDPGVGGHRQGDTDRGRLFRIAPPGNKYTVPKVDYSTTSGAIAALLSPNLATRYKAWQRLHELGRDAEVELLKLYSGADPRMRARAMWLLAQIPTREQHFIDLALSDTDPNLRIVGIRLTKHLKLSAAEKAGKLANDPSPAVRRELAVALRYDSSASMPKVWVDLAKHHDGKDRWYLEALGIGSDVRATECLDAYLAAMKNKWNTPSGRDIVWRVRAPRAAELLVSLIADEQLPLEETSRYFRSLEYQPTQVRAMSMKPLLASKAKSPRSDALIVRALERIDDKDLEKQSHIQEVIQRVISSSKGTSEFLKLVKRFQPSGIDAELRSIILSTENNSLAVQAVEVLYGSEDGPKLVRSLLNDSDDTIAARTAEVLGLQGNQRSIKMLEEIALHAERAYDVRSAAIKGLARNNLGSEKLLTAAADNKLPADTKLLAGGLLSQMSDAKIAQRAKELLPMPQSANQTPFEPLDKLVSKSGDVKRGAELYRTKGTCANCHVVGGAGKQVGPDLSEIGTKLSREALLTSILDPSAGISHNYESYMVLLDSGQVVTGVKVSETDSEFVLRTADAIERNIRKSSIEELEKSHKSIMPDNLHQLLEQQGLIDVVEYLMTLRKK